MTRIPPEGWALIPRAGRGPLAYGGLSGYNHLYVSQLGSDPFHSSLCTGMRRLDPCRMPSD